MRVSREKYAWTATVGEKGQIVIPKQARELYGIQPGDNLIILGDRKKGIAIPPKSSLAEYANSVFEPEKDKKEDLLQKN